MERNRILYSGICCKVNTKAAFVDMCLQTPELSSKMLMRAIVEAKCRDKLFAIDDGKDNIMAVRLELDEEKREKIYEDVFGKRFREGALNQFSEANKKLLEPIEVMHQKEMRIDVIPFIACGIVRNERCRSMLEKSVEDCVGECLDAFRQSEYNATVFLRKFLLEERKAVRLAVGLLLMLRKDEGGERYRLIMDILYSGYRSVKNVIKKLDCLRGERYRDSMARDLTMELELSRMVIQMVIAEDLSVPVIHDYEFCQVICMLKSYEDDRLKPREQEIDLAEGRKIYRKFLKEHWNPGTYYVSAFLEEESDEADEFWERLESLFCQFGIETGALAGLSLEKWEAEMLCAVFEEKNWERYKDLLLIATLCKYIQQIEAMYENDIPEEIQYRRSCEENTVKSMEYEMKRMEQRIFELEQVRKDKEYELAEAHWRLERLKKEISKKEEVHEKERAELHKLRKCTSCKNEETQEEDINKKEKTQYGKLYARTEGESENKEEEKKEMDIGQLDRSIIIGGHRNWQKKMRQHLPGSQFVASDYMHFDPAMLHNKKYIIVNTDILKHGLYYKIMSERKKEQKILYVHGNNVNRTLREIADQL